jgi:hypothetical protein
MPTVRALGSSSRIGSCLDGPLLDEDDERFGEDAVVRHCVHSLLRLP